MNEDSALREQLVALLNGGNAHATLEDALTGLPETLRHVRPEGVPYSVWELVEHIRRTQYDIVEFSRNPDYVSPKWPEGYWPSGKQAPTPEEWENTLARIRKDHQDMVDMVNDPDNALLLPFSHGSGQTLFREAALIADHNAYHIGQIILVRRLLRDWNK